jgi:protein SCO1/2
MNKRAFLAVLMGVFIPLFSYLIVKQASTGALAMPRRYFYDSVSVQMKDGKEISDTIWHKVSNISLVNQLGDSVILDSLNGKVIVADFFFTHCPNICPALTRNMKKMQAALMMKDQMKQTDTSFVQLLSFSVDPVRDSSSILKKYADKYGVDPDNWWLLTGPKKTIYDFALNELKMGIADGEGADSNFIHTQKMVLLDKFHVVRGYYDGLDSIDQARLSRDIGLIILEKDKYSKSVFLELEPLLPMFVIILVGTAAAVYYFSRKPKIPGRPTHLNS